MVNIMWQMSFCIVLPFFVAGLEPLTLGSQGEFSTTVLPPVCDQSKKNRNKLERLSLASIIRLV